MEATPEDSLVNTRWLKATGPGPVPKLIPEGSAVVCNLNQGVLAFDRRLLGPLSRTKREFLGRDRSQDRSQDQSWDQLEEHGVGSVFEEGLSQQGVRGACSSRLLATQGFKGNRANLRFGAMSGFLLFSTGISQLCTFAWR